MLKRRHQSRNFDSSLRVNSTNALFGSWKELRHEKMCVETVSISGPTLKNCECRYNEINEGTQIGETVN